jgi:glycosyltransferase involved in cell wall biosynthesis
VGTVGWLLPIKGPEVLLEAMGHVWQRRSNIALIYVGKGDLEEPLKAMVRRLNVADRVRFLGWRTDIPDLMHSFDIFVLPSRNEGMGRVIVEAMAAGLPVVASRTGGLPDLVSDGHNGFLVPPGDAAALGRAIRKLCDTADLRQRMGEQGRRRAEDFSLQRMVDKLDALYIRMLN